MPILDKPLEELRVYNGSSPCPADIDEYWDNAVAEMKAVERNIELKEAKFSFPGFECRDMYFTGVKGARIHAKLVKPLNIPEPMPAIVHFHGYSGKAHDWLGLISYAACGFCVAGLDCRGQAGESEDVGGVVGNTLHGHIIRGLDNDDPNELLFRHIFLDTAELADIVMSLPYVNEKRVMAMGGSQGGGLTLACASLEPRIYKAAPTYPFLSDYKRVWDMDLDERAYVELKEYFRNFDPRHERENEIFEKLGYIDIQNITKRIKAKIMMFTALRDDVCPPSTQFAAYNKITSPKQVKIYPDFGHEGLPENGEMAMQFFLED